MSLTHVQWWAALDYILYVSRTVHAHSKLFGRQAMLPQACLPSSPSLLFPPLPSPLLPLLPSPLPSCPPSPSPLYPPFPHIQGMVEKWLLQVQVTMIQSLKDVTERSVDAYTTTPREKWVLSWPGQVSPTCSGLVVVCL